MNRATFLGRSVLVAVGLQLVGYAALSALVPHSDLSTAVGPLRAVPTVLLAPVAVLAVPAVVVAIALGAVLSAVGVRPTPVLVLGSAYTLSVVGRLAYRRARHAPRDGTEE